MSNPSQGPCGIGTDRKPPRGVQGPSRKRGKRSPRGAVSWHALQNALKLEKAVFRGIVLALGIPEVRRPSGQRERLTPEQAARIRAVVALQRAQRSTHTQHAAELAKAIARDISE